MNEDKLYFYFDELRKTFRKQYEVYIVEDYIHKKEGYNTGRKFFSIDIEFYIKNTEIRIFIGKLWVIEYANGTTEVMTELSLELPYVNNSIKYRIDFYQDKWEKEIYIDNI